MGARCDGQCREAIVVELVAPLDTKVVRAWLGDASIVGAVFDVTSGRQGRRGTTQQIREHHPVPAHASNPQRLEREL